MLTLKEYNYLTKRNHKLSNLYMLPKLHKSQRINEIIQKQQWEYVNIDENVIFEVRPIVAGSVYQTSGISEILNIIIAKDPFQYQK